jgi:hypothetical protein
LNTGKPVRFFSSNISAEKGQVDGRGNAEVTFKIEFSLADEHGQTIASGGKFGYKCEIWVPGIGYSDANLDLLYGRSPIAYQTQVDLHKVVKWYDVNFKNFYQAADENRRDQIWYATGFRIKLKVDVVEWRYNYAVWFIPKGLFKGKLYEGHESEYWSLKLR